MFPIRDTKPTGRFPFVNLAIIITNIYVFYLELTAPNIDLFISNYALIPSQIDFPNTPSLTPFITSIFMHAGFLHILSNMWFLWVFGDNVEAKIGHIKYLFFYIFAGIAASLGQLIFIGNSDLPMLGASGAIAGALGAYFRFFPGNRVDTLIPVFGLPFLIALPASFMLVYWFFIQAFSGVASILSATVSIGGVAYIAHAAGFLTGVLLARFFAWPNSRKWG